MKNLITSETCSIFAMLNGVHTVLPQLKANLESLCEEAAL